MRRAMHGDETHCCMHTADDVEGIEGLKVLRCRCFDGQQTSRPRLSPFYWLFDAERKLIDTTTERQGFLEGFKVRGATTPPHGGLSISCFARCRSVCPETGSSRIVKFEERDANSRRRSVVVQFENVFDCIVE